MYKNILLLLCFLGVLFCSTTSVLATDESGNNTYQLVSANTDYEVAHTTLNKDFDFYVLTGSSSSTIDIPSLYLDKPVLAISDRAFSEDATITSLNLSDADNLVAIGDFAFKDAVNLTSSIEIVKSIEIIGRSSFRGTNIIEVLFDDDSSLTTISESAFAATKSLNSEITFPDSLNYLGDGAFASSTITKVTFGSNIKSIGSFAFDNATSLTGDLIIDATLGSIGDHAFRGSQITNVDLSNTLLETLLPYTLSNMSTLSKVIFPKNITIVSNDTFKDSDSITELQFRGSSSVTIESDAFTNTDNVTKVVVTSDVMKTYLTSLAILNETVDIEVQEEAVYYSIFFNTNGGSNIDSITLEENSLITKPTDPTKDGHVFVGWFSENNYQNLWNFESDTVSSNTILYAKWEASITPDTKYTVTFNTNGGLSIDVVTVNENSLISEPANPTKENYTFKGWYADRDFNTPWDFSTNKVTENITLYAKWTAVEKESSNTTLIIALSTVVVVGLGTTAYFVLKNKVIK